jgi:hypothetical protein
LGSRFRALLKVGCAIVGFASGIATAQDRALDRLDDLGVALSAEATWTAEYEQEYVPAGMTMGEEAEGRVWLAWPDRALFHTGAPPRRLMGLLGRTVRLVDLDDRTCDEHRLSDREWERVPLAAVLDPGGAQGHFDVVGHGETGIALTPKEPGGVDRVEVILGEGDLPAEVTIRDPQGATNRLIFSGWEAAEEPGQGRWLPSAPDGIECVADPTPLD